MSDGILHDSQRGHDIAETGHQLPRFPDRFDRALEIP